MTTLDNRILNGTVSRASSELDRRVKQLSYSFAQSVYGYILKDLERAQTFHDLLEIQDSRQVKKLIPDVKRWNPEFFRLPDQETKTGLAVKRISQTFSDIKHGIFSVFRPDASVPEIEFSPTAFNKEEPTKIHIDPKDRGHVERPAVQVLRLCDIFSGSVNVLRTRKLFSERQLNEWRGLAGPHATREEIEKKLLLCEKIAEMGFARFALLVEPPGKTFLAPNADFSHPAMNWKNAM